MRFEPKKVDMDRIEQSLAEALQQTGFPFEHHVFSEATRAGWITIPNRLYVDAEEEKTREMDLLCYKAERLQHVMTYTALLISCKARTQKPWVLMTRPWPKTPPAWYAFPPVPTWTNSTSLNHELGLPNWAFEYFNAASANGLKSWAEDSREEVFALQEFEAIKDPKGKKDVRFKSLNDTSLYMGAMGLLKALAYELDAVQQRRARDTDQFAYQFNLVQLLDGELYEASFASGSPKVRSIDRYRYFARTMLGGKEHSARIDFCTKAALPQLLGDMTKVHRFNVGHFNGKYQHFWDNLLTTQTRLNSILHEFEPRAAGWFEAFFSSSAKPQPGWLAVSHDDGALIFELNCDLFVEDVVAENRFFVDAFTRDVRRYFQFNGPVVLKDAIPF
jgi:hypothetical protein